MKMATVCDKCRGQGVIADSPCELCEHGSASWQLIADGYDWKTRKRKTHVEHHSCRETCIRYKMWLESKQGKMHTHLIRTLAEPTELLDIINGKHPNKKLKGVIK